MSSTSQDGAVLLLLGAFLVAILVSRKGAPVVVEPPPVAPEPGPGGVASLGVTQLHVEVV